MDLWNHEIDKLTELFYIKLMPLVRKTSCILFGQQSYGTVKNIGLFTALQCIKIDGGMDFRTILFQFMKMWRTEEWYNLQKYFC